MFTGPELDRVRVNGGGVSGVGNARCSTFQTIGRPLDIENFEFAIQFDSLKKLAFVHKPPQDDHDSIAQKDSMTKLIGAFIVICCDIVVDILPRLIR